MTELKRIPLLRPYPAAFLALAAVFVGATIVLSIGAAPVLSWAPFTLVALTLASAGALVATRHPRNPIGWIFCAFGVVSSATLWVGAYGVRAAANGWPGGEVGEWISTWSWLIEFAAWPVILLLFPDGRLPSPRWRFVPILVPVGWVLAMGYAFSPDNGVLFTRGSNPFAIESPLIDLLSTLGLILLLTALLSSMLALVLRLRRSTGSERQQLKWVTYAATIFGLVSSPVVLTNLWSSSPLIQALFAIVYTFVPAAVAIAILRHRLYDIDVIIRRTLVYGALTLVLGAAYVGSVLGLQALLSPFTANNGPAVAVSTLAVAALFGPYVAAPRGWSTDAFTDRAMTLSVSWRPSPAACATRSTSTA